MAPHTPHPPHSLTLASTKYIWVLTPSPPLTHSLLARTKYICGLTPSPQLIVWASLAGTPPSPPHSLLAHAKYIWVPTSSLPPRHPRRHMLLDNSAMPLVPTALANHSYGTHTPLFCLFTSLSSSSAGPIGSFIIVTTGSSLFRHPPGFGADVQSQPQATRVLRRHYQGGLQVPRTGQSPTCASTMRPSRGEQRL